MIDELGITMKLSDLCNSAGNLLAAKTYSFPELLDEAAVIELVFQSLNCAILANEDTDEIEISSNYDLTAFVRTDIKPIFNEFYGHSLAWVWKLINQQGYRDGLKFEFKECSSAIELIVLASSIKFYKVTGI